MPAWREADRLMVTGAPRRESTTSCALISITAHEDAEAARKDCDLGRVDRDCAARIRCPRRGRADFKSRWMDLDCGRRDCAFYCSPAYAALARDHPSQRLASRFQDGIATRFDRAFL